MESANWLDRNQAIRVGNRHLVLEILDKAPGFTMGLTPGENGYRPEFAEVDDISLKLDGSEWQVLGVRSPRLTNSR